METITAFILSAVTSIWNCFKSFFVGQGTKNEDGMKTDGFLANGGLSGLSGAELAAAALGASLIIAPKTTTKQIGKIGSGLADAAGKTAVSVGENVSDVIETFTSKPWFWVVCGIGLIWLLGD